MINLNKYFINVSLRFIFISGTGADFTHHPFIRTSTLLLEDSVRMSILNEHQETADNMVRGLVLNWGHWCARKACSCLCGSNIIIWSQRIHIWYVSCALIKTKKLGLEWLSPICLQVWDNVCALLSFIWREVLESIISKVLRLFSTPEKNTALDLQGQG